MLRRGDALVEGHQLRSLGRRREQLHPSPRLVAPLADVVDAALFDVGKESRHRVEIAHRERVVLVVVAFGAAERRAEPGPRDVADPVGGILEEVFLGLRAPFGTHHPEPVVGRGDALIERVAGEEITAELLAREAVKRHVLREGPDHPIAVGPHRHLLVAVVADRIGVAHQIEPPRRHPFGMGGAGEEPIDEALESLGGGIGEKGIDLGRFRGEAGEIEGDAAGERRPVGLAGGHEPRTCQLPADEGIDRQPGRGRHRADERTVGPMPLVGGAGGDPGRDRVALLGRDHLVRVGWGHDDVGIGRAEPLEEQTCLWVTWHDRRAAVARRGGPLEGVEPQIGLTVGRIGPVAGKAGIGEDREHVAVEADGRGSRRFSGTPPLPGRHADAGRNQQRGHPARPSNRSLPEHGHAATLLFRKTPHHAEA